MRDSHLRYGGRQQFGKKFLTTGAADVNPSLCDTGLFLKGCGLSLEHALYFFRTVSCCTGPVFIPV